MLCLSPTPTVLGVRYSCLGLGAQANGSDFGGLASNSNRVFDVQGLRIRALGEGSGLKGPEIEGLFKAVSSFSARTETGSWDRNEHEKEYVLLAHRF